MHPIEQLILAKLARGPAWANSFRHAKPVPKPPYARCWTGWSLALGKPITINPCCSTTMVKQRCIAIPMKIQSPSIHSMRLRRP